MATKYKEKRTSITTVRDQYLSFATFPTPPPLLVSHWSLILNVSHLERGGFERRLADEESVHDTAEGPHVGGEAVTLLVQHLGGDVVRGPADSPATSRREAISNLVAVWDNTEPSYV
jgi:hypothetical protein